jgi:hypothetical protein
VEKRHHLESILLATESIKLGKKPKID